MIEEISKAWCSGTNIYRIGDANLYGIPVRSVAIPTCM